MFRHLRFAACVLAGLCASILAAGGKPIASITTIEGTAAVLSTGAADWREARPNMPLRKGDQVATRAESFAELRYSDGAVVRMNENSKVVLVSAADKAVKAENPLGNVWVNMQKIAKGRTFEMASPTAVAAIRGTVFQFETKGDSTTLVAVYEGTVDVGPSDGLKKQLKENKPVTPPGEPTEVPGPQEVPGPYEVSLQQWTAIVAGQRISVRPDGKCAQESFNRDTAAQDAFVRKNIELDKQLQEGK